MTEPLEPAAVVATRHPLIELRPGESLPPVPKTAWLEIDLDAAVANVRLLQRLLPAGTRIEPVVKADAYGHGAVAVSRALVAAGVESLGVATYDEALELRQAGIQVPILVLFPVPAEFAPDALRHSISLTAGDRMLLGRTLAALEAAPPTPGGERLSIHVEVETGLGRGGVAPEDVAELAAIIGRSPRARVAGLWSHLQAAGNREITSGQDRRFGRASAFLEAAGMPMPLRHLAASGALLASTAGTYDSVRIGLSTYGIVPDGLTADPGAADVAASLRPVRISDRSRHQCPKSPQETLGAVRMLSTRPICTLFSTTSSS